jgi:UMF1 family MFS transporter
VDRKQLSWALFDFGNSAYALLILSFVFPIHFQERIADASYASLLWGLMISASVLLGALAVPIIGAACDIDGKRKRRFILFSSLSILGTALLFFSAAERLAFTVVVFIIASMCFEIATSLYDSFLPFIAKRRVVGRLSGFGWGLGYLGGVVAVIALRPLYEHYPNPWYSFTFLATSLFFLVFALPSFIWLPADRIKRVPSVFRQAWRDSVRTVKNWRSFKTFWRFLLAAYLLNDALVTFFAFSVIFVKQVYGLSITEIAMWLIVAQLIGFFASWAVGRISDMTGPKPMLMAMLGLWCVGITTLALGTTMTAFYVGMGAVALTMGSSQAVVRSWLSRIVPKRRASEFFGFNGFASKISAVIGPLLFGAVTTVTGSPRYGLLSLLPFLLVSWFLFWRLPSPR